MGVSSSTPIQVPEANSVVPMNDITPDELYGRIKTLSPIIIQSGNISSGVILSPSVTVK